jgi:hypothetical protein
MTQQSEWTAGAAARLTDWQLAQCLREAMVLEASKATSWRCATEKQRQRARVPDNHDMAASGLWRRRAPFLGAVPVLGPKRLRFTS